MSVTSALPDTSGDLPFMQPVLRRGRSYLDRALLPGDENELRLTRLLAGLTERGLDGVVLFGAAHLPENLVYYANYTPTTFHGVLIARAGEPPILLAGKGGARDHPYIRTVSWVADIRYAADIGEAVAEATREWDGGFGVAGLDTTLPWAVRDGVVAAVGDRAVAVDDVVAAQRRLKTPRELAVLRRAGDVARVAAEAAAQAAAAGAGRRTALAAADHAARAAGAHDCRITAGAPSGGLTTLAEVTDDPGPVSAVVAAEFLGYWGVAAIAVDEAVDPAGSAALDRVVAALRPDRTPAEAVGGADDPGARYLVNGIGCGLTEAPTRRRPGSRWSRATWSPSCASTAVRTAWSSASAPCRSRPRVAVISDLRATTADAVRELAAVPVDDAAREAARLRLVDTMFAVAVGRRTEQGRRSAALGDSLHGSRSVAARAFRLAASCRMTEIDDIDLLSCTTPGAIVVPTVLAVLGSPAVGDAVGADVLDVVARGYEIAVGLGEGIAGPSRLASGVWPSLVVAPVTAAAVTTLLLGGDGADSSGRSCSPRSRASRATPAARPARTCSPPASWWASAARWPSARASRSPASAVEEPSGGCSPSRPPATSPRVTPPEDQAILLGPAGDDLGRGPAASPRGDAPSRRPPRAHRRRGPARVRRDDGQAAGPHPPRQPLQRRLPAGPGSAPAGGAARRRAGPTCHVDEFASVDGRWCTSAACDDLSAHYPAPGPPGCG